MEGTRHAGSGPFMPRKPEQQVRTAVKSVVWAAHSWQRILGLPAPDTAFHNGKYILTELMQALNVIVYLQHMLIYLKRFNNGVSQHTWFNCIIA